MIDVELEEITLVLFNERGSGRLTEIPVDFFAKVQGYLGQLYDEAGSIEYFLSDRAGEILNEKDSIEGRLEEIIRLRFAKILKLAEHRLETGHVDHSELKRMLPPERELFEEISASFQRCRDELISFERRPVSAVPPSTEPSPPLRGADPVSHDSGKESLSSVIRMLQDTEPFMGTDGRIYSLAREDVVVLPSGNAAVLCERNIALNIRLGK